MFLLVYLAVSEQKICSKEFKIYNLDNMAYKLNTNDKSFCINFDFKNNIPKNNILSMNFASPYNYTIEVYDSDNSEIKFTTTIKSSTVILNQTKGFIIFTPSNTTNNTTKSIVMKKIKITRNIKNTLSSQKYINIKRSALEMSDGVKIAIIVIAVYVVFGIIAIIIFCLSLSKHPNRIIRFGCLFYCCYSRFPGLFNAATDYYYLQKDYIKI